MRKSFIGRLTVAMAASILLCVTFSLSVFAVGDVPTTSIKISGDKEIKASLNAQNQIEDKMASLTAVVNKGASANVKWISSDESVLTVESENELTATVKARSYGTATVFAMAQDKTGKTASHIIKVSPTSPASSVVLNGQPLDSKGKPKTSLIDDGKNEIAFRLNATVMSNAKDPVTKKPLPATSQEVAWTSSNSNVATVTSNGAVMIVGHGDVTISATTTDGSKKIAAYKFKVVPQVPASIFVFRLSTHAGNDIPLDKSNKATIRQEELSSERYEQFRVECDIFGGNKDNQELATNQEVVWSLKNTGTGVEFFDSWINQDGYLYITPYNTSKHVITATTTDGTKKSASFTIDVIAANNKPETLMVEPKTTANTNKGAPGPIEIRVGESVILNGIVGSQNAYDKLVSWKTSDTKGEYSSYDIIDLANYSVMGKKSTKTPIKITATANAKPAKGSIPPVVSYVTVVDEVAEVTESNFCDSDGNIIIDSTVDSKQTTQLTQKFQYDTGLTTENVEVWTRTHDTSNWERLGSDTKNITGDQLKNGIDITVYSGDEISEGSYGSFTRFTYYKNGVVYYVEHEEYFEVTDDAAGAKQQLRKLPIDGETISLPYGTPTINEDSVKAYINNLVDTEKYTISYGAFDFIQGVCIISNVQIISKADSNDSAQTGEIAFYVVIDDEEINAGAKAGADKITVGGIKAIPNEIADNEVAVKKAILANAQKCVAEPYVVSYAKGNDGLDVWSYPTIMTQFTVSDPFNMEDTVTTALLQDFQVVRQTTVTCNNVLQFTKPDGANIIEDKSTELGTELGWGTSSKADTKKAPYVKVGKTILDINTLEDRKVGNEANLTAYISYPKAGLNSDVTSVKVTYGVLYSNKTSSYSVASNCIDTTNSNNVYATIQIPFAVIDEKEMWKINPNIDCTIDLLSSDGTAIATTSCILDLSQLSIPKAGTASAKAIVEDKNFSCGTLPFIGINAKNNEPIYTLATMSKAIAKDMQRQLLKETGVSFAVTAVGEDFSFVPIVPTDYAERFTWKGSIKIKQASNEIIVEKELNVNSAISLANRALTDFIDRTQVMNERVIADNRDCTTQQVAIEAVKSDIMTKTKLPLSTKINITAKNYNSATLTLEGVTIEITCATQKGDKVKTLAPIDIKLAVNEELAKPIVSDIYDVQSSACEKIELLAIVENDLLEIPKEQLSYQWYEHYEYYDDYSGFHPIDGATSDIFAPNVMTAGVKYYYCNVTNSKPYCDSISTKTNISKVTTTGVVKFIEDEIIIGTNNEIVPLWLMDRDSQSSVEGLTDGQKALVSGINGVPSLAGNFAENLYAGVNGDGYAILYDGTYKAPTDTSITEDIAVFFKAPANTVSAEILDADGSGAGKCDITADDASTMWFKNGSDLYVKVDISLRQTYEYGYIRFKSNDGIVESSIVKQFSVPWTAVREIPLSEQNTDETADDTSAIALMHNADFLSKEYATRADAELAIRSIGVHNSHKDNIIKWHGRNDGEAALILNNGGTIRFAFTNITEVKHDELKDAAKDELSIGIQNAYDIINPVQIAMKSSEVNKGIKWTTQAVYSEMWSDITEAEKARASDAVTLDEIKNARAVLIQQLTIFESKLRIGTNIAYAQQPIITISNGINQSNRVVGGMQTELAIKAEVTDGGILSYQWYQMSGNCIDVQNDKLMGASDSALRITSSGNIGDIKRYYCAVTNKANKYMATAYSDIFDIEIIEPIAVTNRVKAGTQVLAYNGEAIDLREMFDIDPNAGEQTYEVIAKSGEGAGEVKENLLIVSKVGVFEVKLVTAANGCYAAGEALYTDIVVEKGTHTPPAEVDFSFDGINKNKLLGVTDIMAYSLDGGTSWNDCTSDIIIDSTKVTAENDIQVKIKSDDMYNESSATIIAIGTHAVVTGCAGYSGDVGSIGGLLVGVAYEYRLEHDTTYTLATADENGHIGNLDAGRYYIRFAPSGKNCAGSDSGMMEIFIF